MTVALIDYGAGNVPSVERALQKLGAPPFRTSNPDQLLAAHAIILPGVGHYAALIRALDEQQLRAPLVHAIHRGVPFLGICLGLQALYESSEEASQLHGLNLFPGQVSSLPKTRKLPHMGWNQLQFTRSSRILNNISRDAFFYFAHSFAAIEPNGEAVALCDYGAPFVAVLESKNIYATQFHPEKSGEAGSRLLQNFLSIAAESRPAKS